MHLGTVSMLHKSAPIFVSNCANVVLTDHHLCLSDGVSFRGARDWRHIFADVVLIANSFALVVGHNPLHFFLGEVSDNAIGVQDLRIAVV